MLGGGGAVVNMASAAGLTGTASLAAHAAGKFVTWAVKPASPKTGVTNR